MPLLLWDFKKKQRTGIEGKICGITRLVTNTIVNDVENKIQNVNYFVKKEKSNRIRCKTFFEENIFCCF